VKPWEIIADRLSAAGWSWGCVSTINSNGQTLWIVDAHRSDAGRFIIHADQELPAFLELESAIQTERNNHECDCPKPDEESGSNR
jgi:hypothetical protein